MKWGIVLAIVLGATTARAADKAEPVDYDGRGKEPTRAGEVAAWVPRVAFFPLHVVTEYGIRQPVGAAMTWAERKNIPAKIYELFVWGPDHNMGIIPSAFYELGFLPSVGAYFFWDDPKTGNHFRIHGATWGKDWIALTVGDRFSPAKGTTVGVRFEAKRRADLAYYGMGPESGPARFRYAAETFKGEASVTRSITKRSTVSAKLEMASTTFREGACCGDLDIRTAVDRKLLDMPQGFGDSWVRLTPRVDLEINEGKRLGIHAKTFVAPSVVPSSATSWVRYGASIQPSIDLTGHHRVLAFRVAGEMVHSFAGTIPFTEQVRLGGFDGMPGLAQGRLIGQSAVSATLSYSWPVWSFLDGTIHASVGNVFGHAFDGFDAKKLRLSTGIGVKSSGSDHPFELVVALGTDTFERGASVESVRFFIGVHPEM